MRLCKSSLKISEVSFFFERNIWNKFGKSFKIGQNQKALISAFSNLDRFYQYFISERKTGYQAMSPPVFEISLKFPNFLRSIVNGLATR